MVLRRRNEEFCVLWMMYDEVCGVNIYNTDVLSTQCTLLISCIHTGSFGSFLTNMITMVSDAWQLGQSFFSTLSYSYDTLASLLIQP